MKQQRIGREPFRGDSELRRDQRRREQFLAHKPLAIIAIGEHMRDHGLGFSSINALDYECLIQVALRPDQVEAWLVSGTVTESTTTEHESPFGPMQRRGVTRIVFGFRLPVGICLELVTFHELAAVGGGR